MAEKIDVITNANKIYAKLHLAARDATNSKFIFNSGIENDKSSATPENPGDVLFNFDNKSGIYQLGQFEILKFKPEEAAILLKLLDNEEESNKNKDKNKDKDKDKNKDKNKDKDKDKNKDDKFEKFLNNFKKTAFTNLKNYFSIFAGKTAIKNLKEDSLQLTILPEKTNDISMLKFKDFNIETMKKDKFSKFLETCSKAPTKQFEIVLCYLFAYNIDKK